MTSLQWIYEEGTDGPTRIARKEAMAYADNALRGVAPVKMKPSDAEREALRLRKSELTWSDIRSSAETSAVVAPTAVSIKTVAYGVFWAVCS